jgi:hypothetical protein
MGRRARRRPEDDKPEKPDKAADRREAPGAVLKGPPIAVQCECGVKHDVAYGESWTCESCGRTWNTAQIPAEEYAQIRQLQLRYRAVPVALGLILAAIAIFFSLTGNVFSVFFLLPVGLMTWFVIVRPVHRKRYKAAIANLPRWDLRPE